MPTRFERIYGSLAGSAIGDAMGAVTETKTTRIIKERWGGYVTDMIDPPDDCFARVNKRGVVTDDFSLTFLITKALIKSGGTVSKELIESVLLEWSELPQYYIPHIGPNSRGQILKLKGIEDHSKDHLIARNDLVTNGTAMKMSPIGLLNPGDLDRAVEDTIVICMPTHPTCHAISGGAAIAAAVACAMTDGATKADIVEAGLYGAKTGYERAKPYAVPSSGARIERRIPMAVDIALKYGSDYDRLLYEMASVVGTGLPCADSAAAVFGFFIAAKDPMDVIKMGVNAGGDTDSVATMSGAIFGAMTGVSAFDEADIALIEEKNTYDAGHKHFDLGAMAKSLNAVIERRAGRTAR